MPNSFFQLEELNNDNGSKPSEKILDDPMDANEEMKSLQSSQEKSIQFPPVWWDANSLDFDKDYDASMFETIIRVVGGLLGAYDLSGDKIFLEKARNIC